MKSVLLSLVLVALSAVKVLGQKQDFLVTTSGDTIKADVKKISAYKIKYKADSDWVKLDSKHVRLYYDAKKDEKFMSVLMPLIDPAFPDPKFKQVLEEGKINLFVEEYTRMGGGMMVNGMMMPTGSSYSGRNLYVQKGTNNRAWEFDRKFVGVKDNGTEASRKKFEELIADQPELLKKFQEEKKISFEELRTYIIRYNAAQ